LANFKNLKKLDFYYQAKYDLDIDSSENDDLCKVLGTVIKRQRAMVPLTLLDLAKLSGISASYLARIERGERYPSARVLRQIAKPLGFDEDELFVLAGYLSHDSHTEVKESSRSCYYEGLDLNVARILSQQSFEMQRTVIGILDIIKSVSSNIAEEPRTNRIERPSTRD
jgi:transcriptional regulator with XRE-family HTH domain